MNTQDKTPEVNSNAEQTAVTEPGNVTPAMAPGANDNLAANAMATAQKIVDEAMQSSLNSIVEAEKMLSDLSTGK